MATLIFPATLNYTIIRKKFLSSFDVPENITILSNWFYHNTNIKSGYKIYSGSVFTSTNWPSVL